MKENKGNIVIIVIGIVLYIACFIFQRQAPQSVSGIIAQAEVVITIVMLLFGKKRGLFAGVVLNGLSAAAAFINAFRSENRVGSLADAVVSLIAIGILLLIYFYLNRTDKMDAELQESYQEAIEKNRIIEEQNERVEFLSNYDSLTRMPNRQMFMEHLEEQIKENGDCVVIYIDMDDFRRINDSFGHEVGDDLLRRYAEKLERYCGSKVFAAKIGGDEFGIIIGSGMTNEAIYQYAAGISGIFSEPVNLGGNFYTVTASYGAASFPENAMTAADLFRCAETAMFNAKASGKNQLCFYTKQG